MIRMRHYTRVSSMRMILAEGVIRARDQNKVFVELASARKLSPQDAVKKYGLDPGKGNAYIEFEIADDLLMWQRNPQLKVDEYFTFGDVLLGEGEFEAFFNIRGSRSWKPKL
jgi:hypothetical protein